jgi:hypothetical protein
MVYAAKSMNFSKSKSAFKAELKEFIAKKEVNFILYY